jgi:hypothetical protein
VGLNDFRRNLALLKKLGRAISFEAIHCHYFCGGDETAGGVIRGDAANGIHIFRNPWIPQMKQRS